MNGNLGLDAILSDPYNRPYMPAAASTRFEFRLRAEAKQRIEHAARLAQESTSDFVRHAAERSAEEVLTDHDAVTVVPPEFFDRMLAALEEAPAPNPALARAAQRAGRLVQR